MADSREPRRERTRIAFAIALAVLPPLVLLGYLAVKAVQHDRDALRAEEEGHARDVAVRARDAIALGVRAAEQGCFPTDLSQLRSRDPAARAALEKELEALRRQHPIAARFVALDEDGKLIVPDPGVPWRAEASPPDDGPVATSPEEVARWKKADEEYARGQAYYAKKNTGAAVNVLLNLVHDDATPGPLRVRALYRLGLWLESSDRREHVLDLYHEASIAPWPAREDGIALRPASALRRAELLRASGQALGAYEQARDLALALLEGSHRDLPRAEWEATLARAQKLVADVAATWSGVAPSDPLAVPPLGQKLLEKRERELRERVAWASDLQGELGEPLRAALQSDNPEELLHLSSLKDRVLIAYRVLSPLPLDASFAANLRTKRLLFGVEIDSDRLGLDVISPSCADISYREGNVSIAVLDGHGLVRGYAGADAAPDEQRRPRESEAITAAAPLEPPPLWQVRAYRAADRFQRDMRRRMIVFASLVALALVATLAGGTATFRSVARSLELARMKQDFVSNVTHELKTPLTSIKMYAETLSLGRQKDEEKKKEYLNHIIRESERLHRLIDDILDFARLGEGKRPFVLAEGDVTECVQEAIVLFRHSAEVRGFELYLDLPALGALPPVDLDRDAIVRCVLNLLSNAVKYSGDSKYVRVSCRREGDLIAAAVEDRGIGIEEEDLDRIFERFYRVGDHLTREVSGAGLGLALVDEVIRSHGGQIRVESTKGKGSTFTILLPIVPDYRNVAWPPAGSDVQATPPADKPAGGSGEVPAQESEPRA